MHRPVSLPSLVVALLLLTGCGTGVTPESTGSTHQSGVQPSVATPSTPGVELGTQAPTSPVSEHLALIATSAHESIEIWDKPGGSVTSTIAAADVLTAPDVTPLVFLVESQQADWYHVYLPVRPNGSTGWVRGSQVEVAGTDFALDVYLSDHTLVLKKGGEELARFPLGVGRADRPTPGGVYYLRELLSPPDPNDIYGPYAYGLSGYSPVLDSFRGGDAVIGLHGTNDPASIGGDVSSGCLRMNNADVTALVENYGLPLGTPVYIHD